MNVFKVILSTIILFTFFTNIIAQDLSFNIEVTSKKTTEPMVIKVSSNGSKTVMQPMNMGPQGSMKILVDSENNKQYMLMEANGKKMAMSVDPFNPSKEIEKTKEPKITVTNETKTIDGFKCNKIIAETDNHISDVWLTQEAGLSYPDLYKIMNSSKGASGAGNVMPALSDVKGFPIEIVSKDKKKDETVTMNIRNISRDKLDASYFSLDGYQVTDLRKNK